MICDVGDCTGIVLLYGALCVIGGYVTGYCVAWFQKKGKRDGGT